MDLKKKVKHIVKVHVLMFSLCVYISGVLKYQRTY